jgi:hypothetical protein
LPSVPQQQPDGTQCIRPQTVPGARSLFGNQADEAQARAWQTQSQLYPMCPGQTAAQVDPVVFAIAFWRDVKLPEPKPYVAPGWAITGKEAYLETRGERGKTYTSDTPFGPLELVASGRYSVDWGDGTRSGPFDFEGQPWPDGRITHTYIDVGTYTIKLREDWSATWRIGGANGTLSGLRTDASIDNFRVEQIQVVIGAGP